MVAVVVVAIGVAIWWSWVGWKQAGGPLLFFSPGQLAVTMTFLASWPTLVYASFSQRLGVEVLLAGLLSVAALVTGMVAGAHFARVAPAEISKAPTRPVLLAGRASSPFSVLFLFVGCVAVAVYLYQGLPPTLLGLIDLGGGGDLSGVSGSIREARFDLTKSRYLGGEYGGEGVLRTILLVGFPFLVVLCLAYWLETRRKIWAVSLAGASLVGVIVLLGDGTRARFIYGGAFVLAGYSLLQGLRLRRVLVGGLMLLLVFTGASLVVGKIRLGDDWVSGVVTEPIDRALMGNGRWTLQAIELTHTGELDIPTGDLHLGYLLNGLPGVQARQPLGRDLYVLTNPGSRLTTYGTATYLGTVYVDFGLLGVAVVYFLLGVLVMFGQKLIISVRKTPENVAWIAGVVSSLGLAPFVERGIASLPPFWVVLSALYLFVNLGKRSGRTKRIDSANGVRPHARYHRVGIRSAISP